MSLSLSGSVSGIIISSNGSFSFLHSSSTISMRRPSIFTSLSIDEASQATQYHFNRTETCSLKLTKFRIFLFEALRPTMDSEVRMEGRLIDIVDDEWRKEKLPFDDIIVPETKPDNDHDIETFKKEPPPPQNNNA